MARTLDLAGKRFGRLVAVEPTEKRSASGSRIWLCNCDCGKKTEVIGPHLVGGNTQSCGCFGKESQRAGSRKAAELRTTHGMAGTRLYQVWRAMIGRCENEKVKSFKNYGGRGIKVCPRWRASFQAFLDDMGSPPSEKHSVERKDNDGDYCPENCRWATKQEQARNTRFNRPIEFQGETRILSDWARISGIPLATLHRRLTLGWTVIRALTTPVDTSKRHVSRSG